MLEFHFRTKQLTVAHTMHRISYTAYASCSQSHIAISIIYMLLSEQNRPAHLEAGRPRQAGELGSS